jgi:transposase InsO family protein
MRETIEQYIRTCDPCHRRKEYREMIAPLGDVEEPKNLFKVTSMDITRPYPTTQRRNKYPLTFIDHLTKYVEAFPIPDHTAETCAKVYASQIVTRHGSGSTLITDQGREFMSSFFQKTCKILGVRRLRTSSYHAAFNGMVERLHCSLHSGLSHYVNASHKNWDEVVPYYLMSHRATPHTTTGYSPFYLLHGREMILPRTENLKARLPKDHTDEN